MSEPVQPDPQYIIAAQQEELNAANANRVYLLAIIKQLQQNFADAQELWAVERESLIKTED